MVMAWAKLPSAWAKVRKPEEMAISASEPGDDGSSSALGLYGIRWKTHGSTGTGALIVLLALAILSNLRQRGGHLREGNQVLATYTDLENMTGLSRVLISRSLRLLEELKAISTERVGNACAYALLGIENGGGWCAAPQAHLLDGTDYLKRLRGIRETIRRPASLFAMKLYMLLLTFRDRRSNTTRISYEAITSYSGMRREDISLAWQILAASQLGYLADDIEEPLKSGERKHNRYKVRGLQASS